MYNASLVVTIWMALIAYTFSELGRTRVIPGITNRWNRRVVSCACLLYVAHVVAAFQLRYDWSHAAAYAHTAAQSAATVGLDWGAGIFLNYAFTVLWLAEVAWWWVAPKSYETRPSGVDLAVRAIFLVMIVNGAVVFVPGVTRWLGAVLAAALLIACARIPRHRPAQP